MREQNNYNRYEEEVDLKELFMVLWKSKKIIVTITLIVAILAGIFTMFLIEPVYEAKLDLIVNMPPIVNTKYGDYTMMMTTNDQYISLIYSNSIVLQTMQDMKLDMSKNSIEKFSDKISISKDEKTPNSFTVKVQAKSSSEALEMAKNLYKNYINFLDTTIKSRSSEYFINYYTTELSKDEVILETNKKLLKQNQDMLKQIPQTINQKDALPDLNINSIDYIVLENIMNDNYKKVELDIITIEQTIIDIENKIELSKQYLDELEQIKNNIANSNLNIDFCEVVEDSVYLPSQPVAPSHKTSPSTMLNVVIGAVIGGMISVIYVLIKKYWFTEAK